MRKTILYIKMNRAGSPRIKTYKTKQNAIKNQHIVGTYPIEALLRLPKTTYFKYVSESERCR